MEYETNRGTGLYREIQRYPPDFGNEAMLAHYYCTIFKSLLWLVDGYTYELQ